MADTDLTNRIAGTAFVSVSGRTIPLRGDLAYGPVKVARETVTGMDHVHGFKEAPAPGKIKMTVSDSQGLVVADFNAMRNVTIILELANGKMVTGRDMWTVEALEVDAGEAKFEVTWEGFDGCVVEN